MAKSTLYIFLISAIFMLTCQHTFRNKFFGDSKINILYFSILYMYMYQSMKSSNNALFKSIFNNLFQTTIPDTTLVTEEIPGSFVPPKQLEAPSQIIVEQVKTVEQPAQGSATEKNNNEAVVGVTKKQLKRNNSNTNQSKSKRKKNARQKNIRKKLVVVNNTPTQLHVDTSDKKDHHVSDDLMEVPCLSDSESTIGSPTLSAISLPDEQQHYYSLFSTGFDFVGVSPNLTLSQEQKFHQTSHHLAFQNKVPSVENIGKRRSLLDMLDQDQQAQTTITPAAFSYFDEMMMSTSLYKFDQWQGFAR